MKIRIDVAFSNGQIYDIYQTLFSGHLCAVFRPYHMIQSINILANDKQGCTIVQYVIQGLY